MWLIIQNKLVQWGAAVLAVLGLILSIYRAGSKAQAAKQDKANLKAMEKAHEIENKVNALSDDDIDKRLRKWKR